MKKLLLAFLFAILCSVPARAQTPVLVQGGNPSATLVVCTFPAIGYPCTNPATIYTTSALSTPIPQPVALGFGSITFYVSSASNYMGQITGGDSRQFIIYGGAGAGSAVTSVAFAGDGVVDSSTPSAPVTTSGNVSATLNTQAANTVFGNFTGSTAAPTFSAAPVFSAALLTNFPTLNQNTTGSAANVSWSGNTNPTGNLSLTMGSNSSTFNTTTAVSQFFSWKNTTAALVGASQSSPLNALCGTEWHGGASVEGCETVQFVPGTGSDAANTIAFGHSGSATGVTTTTFPGPLQSGGTNGGLSLPEGTCAGVPATSAQDNICGNSTAHQAEVSNNGGGYLPITQTVATGTAAMNTAAVASGACETVVTVSATGVATTDTISTSFNGDPSAVTGYGASASGAVLTIYPYPTSGNVNFKVCNSTANSITPSALTLNWRVAR